MSDDTPFSSMFPGYVPPYPVVIVIDPNTGDRANASALEMLFDSKGGEILQPYEELPRALAALFQYLHSDIDLDWSKFHYLYAEYNSEQTAREAVLFAKMAEEETIKSAIRLDERDWNEIYGLYEVYVALDRLRYRVVLVEDAIGDYIDASQELPFTSTKFHKLHKNDTLAKLIDAEETRFSSYLNLQLSKMSILG